MTDWSTKLDTGEDDLIPQSSQVKGYEVPTANLTIQDAILLHALKIAVANGWTGWRQFVNDAVTVGMEVEGVLRDMKRSQAPIEPLIFNIEFAKSLWGDTWQEDLMFMVIEEDRIQYLADNTG